VSPFSWPAAERVTRDLRKSFRPDNYRDWYKYPNTNVTLSRKLLFTPAAAFVIAASWIVASLLCPTGSLAQVTNANVTLAVNTTKASATAIPSDFSGLSFEMGSVIYDSVNNGWLLSGSNGAMISLAKTLGVKSIRVGGSTAEGGDIAVAADEDAVLDFCHAIGANLIWDLEIDGTLYDASTVATDTNSKPIVAQSMHTYANSKGYLINTNSLVFQVGNEPDLMPNMTDTIYDSDFGSYRTAINSLFSGVRMAGPDTSAGGTFYFPTFCPAEGPGGDIAFACQHLYPFGSSLTGGTVAQEIAAMLSSGNEAGYQSFMQQWVPSATAAGLAPRYEETNSFFHNGVFGSSNAYASALWGLGYIYYHAQAGLAGLNFHIGSNSNAPAYNAISPATVASSYTVNPLGYAIAAFNIGGHGHMVPVTIGNSSDVNLVAYSVLQGDGSLVITAINREYGSPAFNAALSISTSGTTYNDGQVMFLTGSNNDPSTLTGVTLGGSAISGTGAWSGTYMGMARPSAGSFALNLPLAQAAIIRLFSANGPASPANLTGTSGNTRATLNWTASTGATSYAVERSGTTGGPYTTVATGVSTNSYIDTSVTNGLTYYYVVAASSSNGIGPQSAEVAVSVPDLPPLPPTGLAGAPGDSVVALSWNVSVGATNYIVESSTSSNGTYSIIASTPDVGFLNTGLTDGRNYYYTVSAVGPYGQSAPSAAIGVAPFVNAGIGWTNTVTSSAQSWNLNPNWSNGTAFPNATQAVALINSAIAATQTINVNQAITIGELDVGASGGAASFNIAPGGGTLTFGNLPAPASVTQLASSHGDTISAPLVIDGSLNVSNSSSNPLTFTGDISGTNDFSIIGGTVALGGATTFSGTATITQGTLELTNSLALQDSILNYTAGNVTFSGITSATVGGITGTHNLSLVNLGSQAVALTVGSLGGSYSGGFTGAGSLTVNTAATLIITGSNNYTGGTTILGGNLTVAGGTLGTSSSTIIVGNGAGGVSFFCTGGVVNASDLQLATVGGSTGDFVSISGTGSATFALVNLGSSGNTSGPLIINTTGTVNLGTLVDAKDLQGTGPNTGCGLIIDEGTVTASSILIQNTSSGANMNLTGGSSTIGTASSSGAFKIGNAGSTRGGFLTMTGGSLTYPGTDGLLLNTNSGSASGASFSGANTVATLTGITLNQANAAGVTSWLVVSNGATLYLGSVGLVANQPSATVYASMGSATLGAAATWSSIAPVTLTGTLTIQAANANADPYNISLNGAFSGSGGLVKTGAGILTLGGSGNYTGATTVSAGTLLIAGTVTSGNNVTVQNAATLDVSAGTLTSATTTVASGGTLINDGTINGALVNNGTVLSNSGATMAVSGNVTNNGTTRITGGTTLAVSGTFTNNGILDIMTGSPTLPAKFVNNGTVLNSSLVEVKSVGMTAAGLTIAIQTYAGHTYQLQGAASLTNPVWVNVTANFTTQTNGNGLMTYTLTNIPGGFQYYRIQVGP